MTDEINEILEEYRKTCWLVKDNLDNENAVSLQALANINTKTAIQKLLDKEVDNAERKGEISQLQLQLHWAKLHDMREVIEYSEHVLNSLHQFPEQPLASQVFKDLSLGLLADTESNKEGSQDATTR